jgi:hypothetical protein
VRKVDSKGYWEKQTVRRRERSTVDSMGDAKDAALGLS